MVEDAIAHAVAFFFMCYDRPFCGESGNHLHVRDTGTKQQRVNQVEQQR
jgi:hypothetical protein